MRGLRIWVNGPVGWVCVVLVAIASSAMLGVSTVDVMTCDAERWQRWAGAAVLLALLVVEMGVGLVVDVKQGSAMHGSLASETRGGG